MVDMDSTNTILTIALKEYEYESNRAGTLDTRASTFLTISIATFALIANIAKPSNITSPILAAFFEVIFFLLLIVLAILSLTTLFDGNFGTDNDGEDWHLQLTLTVAIPIRLMTEQAPESGLS